MQGLAFVLLFTALTFLSWGAYGPLLRYGTSAMSHDGLKAFVGVGLAYFVIAVIVPFWILRAKGEKGKWTLVGTSYSIVAGSVGAIGALGIILALVFHGDPVFVMPLVFGFAPIVNTLVTAWMGGNLKKIRPVFVGGIIAAALGASGVLYFKPSGKPAAALALHQAETPASGNKAEKGKSGPTEPANVAAEPKQVDNPTASAPKPEPDGQLAPTKPTESAKPTEPKPTEPAKPEPSPVASTKIETPAAPLFAALPASGSPPQPTQAQPIAQAQPIVAAMPAEGLPPVPDKPVPALVADLPAEGNPPVPEKPAPASTNNQPTNEPPPVVNPESDNPAPGSPQPAQPATPPATPQPQAPKVELPPPVPNPEADISRTRQTIRSRFVAMVDIQATAPALKNQPSTEAEEPAKASDDKASSAGDAHQNDKTPNRAMIALSILMAALCWGSYGPMLHQGQMKMGGSRLRPFACVGIAYFIIAVAVPLFLIANYPTLSAGSWNPKGMFWSVIAGGAGAVGALGIILAFNAGGKPIYVMPLVFGFAPVINTFISLTEAGVWSQVRTEFWISLGVVIAGAITVLTTAPKAAHGPAHAAQPKPAGT